MTQCERILAMLKAAGKRGVRSDEFFRVGLPRGVARIYDLRKKGYEIEDEPEGKYKRFRLQDHHSSDGIQAGVKSSVDPREVPVGGSVAESRLASAGGPERSVPSMFDADECVDWGAAA